MNATTRQLFSLQGGLLLVWPLILLLSFVGWGAFLARLLKFPMDEIFTPLKAAWGLALSFGVMGFFLVFEPARLAWVFTFWIALGCVCFVRSLIAENRPRVDLQECEATLGWRTLKWTLLAFFWISVGYQFLQEFIDPQFGVWDDFMAYFLMAKRLLSTGTMSDPFLYRRLGAYGGQTVLHSFFLLAGSEQHLNIIDKGICRLLAAWLVTCMFKGDVSKNCFGLALGFCFLWAEMPMLNTAPLASGIFVYLALLLTLQPTWAGGGRVVLNSGRLILCGLLVNAMVVLRPTYIPGVMILFATLLASSFFGSVSQEDQKRRLSEILRVAGLSLLLVLPWSVLLYRSSLSPLFPLFKGVFNSEYGTFFSRTPSKNPFQMILETLGSHDLQVSMGMGAIALGVSTLSAFVLPGSWSPLLAGAVIASVLVPCAISASLPASEQAIHGIRYAYPFIAGSVILSLCVLIESLGKILRVRGSLAWRPRIRQWGVRVSIMGLGSQIALILCGVPSSLRIFPELLRPWSWSYPSDRFNADRAALMRLQNSVPASSRIIVALDLPFLLDFNRNRIWSFDVPGQASPPPGLPVGKGWQEIDAYLRLQGIEYVIFIDPEFSVIEYDRKLWSAVASGAKKSDSFFKDWAEWHLKFFDYLEMKKKNGMLYSDGKFYAARI